MKANLRFIFAHALLALAFPAAAFVAARRGYRRIANRRSLTALALRPVK